MSARAWRTPLVRFARRAAVEISEPARIGHLLRIEPQMSRRLLAEYLGSLLLGAIVVGSGIMAQQLSPGDVGLELLENAAATAAGLYVLITLFAPLSGAHFNPAVSFVDAALGGISWRRAISYLPAQLLGCSTGSVIANLMFSRHAVSLSTHHRASWAHLGSEVVATAGLLLVIFGLSRSKRGSSVAAAVACYIGAAYFFTSSTSFANPAIAVGRTLSNSFAGIAPSSVAGFVGAEMVGAILGFGLLKVLFPTGASIEYSHHPQRENDEVER